MYIIFDPPCNSYNGGTFVFKIEVNQELFTEYNVRKRLSGLGFLFIENYLARQLNLSKIINNFTEKKKARKRNFY